MKAIPQVSIKRRYYIYLFFINLLSVLLHECGHALAILIMGGQIVSYQIVRVISNSSLMFDPYVLLGGPVVTLLLCLLATYKIDDIKNSDKWLATIFCNLSPLIALMLYITGGLQDETYVFIYELGVPPLIFFVVYFLIFSVPVLILIRIPKLPPTKKIVFYLNNIAVILLQIFLLNILNRMIFG